MNKYFISTIFILLAVFSNAANASQNRENLNHLLSKKQLSQFCESIGVVSNTRIKIKLPTGITIFGTITCEKK